MSLPTSLASNTTVSASFCQLYRETLLSGDRVACRALIDGAIAKNMLPYDLLTQLVWPTMETLQSLYREDRIATAALNLATRLNRMMTDQLCGQLPRSESKNKKVLIFCGNDEPEELGGQICADLFECNGWTVRFGGGGVPDDEVLKPIGEYRPDLLVMFGTLPTGVPAVRKLIDYLREVGSCPQMQVMCCGGIYKRAEGLAEEIGADLYAPDASEAVQVANAHPTKKATVDQQTVGRTRRIRKAQARKSQQQLARASRTPPTSSSSNTSMDNSNFSDTSIDSES